MIQVSQSTHRQAFIDRLADDIRDLASDKQMPFYSAAARVLLLWLGYDDDDVMFVDQRDHGIDAWIVGESSIDIFQIKTHDVDANGDLRLGVFDGQGIRDLERAKNFLLYETGGAVSTKDLKDLLRQWNEIIRNHKQLEKQLSIPITLHLIILGDQLTSQAHGELRHFQAANASPVIVQDVPVEIHATLHTINSIIDKNWRETNRGWSDKKGQKFERIILRPWHMTNISDNANAVFYCRAIDLVTAYDALGYQIFEPNVRANITNSRVNQDIRDSVLHQRTRREFRFLNNGVTITCNNFAKPNQQRPHFVATHPGIVNGLQTVVALHTAYEQLSVEDKKDFEENCSVLVRLLVNSAVDDITRVVTSTNNQNPMKPRNLVSNHADQVIYARLFADLNWFYEAKEGAWDAFDNDSKRWRPALHKSPKDFRIGRKVRRIDNQDVAQTWFAFIGFSEEAINNKKSLFLKRFYPLIFSKVMPKHGRDYAFALASAEENAIDKSPSAELMLVSYLSREFANAIVPTTAQNRELACARLGIDARSLSIADLDSRLSKDSSFVVNQVLRGMSFLFTEFVGFCLYHALGRDIHRYGRKILANHSFAALASVYDTDAVRDTVQQERFDQHDLLCILWLNFVETVDELYARGWGDSYRAATAKARFIHSHETRERLYRAVQETDEFMKKRALKKNWAIGVAEGQGLFAFIKSCIDGAT